MMMTTLKKKMELVFIPYSGISHTISTLQTAKHIASRDQRISITILLVKPPSPVVANIINLLALDQKSIRLLQLRVPDSISALSFGDGARFFASNREILMPIVREAIISDVLGRPGSGILAGLVIDMLYACMVDVAKEFQVPSYIYIPISASAIGLMYHMKALRDEHGTDGSEFMNSDAVLDIPTFSHPFPAKILPLIFFNSGSAAFFDLTKRFNESNGILINTFPDLESRAIRVLSENEKLPAIYTVGPIINHENSVGEERDEIISWLDGQPPSSVAFLCFGTMGTFPEAQVKEIAVALERGRHRFLWSLKMPPSSTAPITDVLPKGFLERTRNTGKLVGWAPQMEVLSHHAVGGFVSHCGWNSVLESLWCGVPVAVWPLCGDQPINAFLMVKELELAAEVKMDYGTEDIVAAPVIDGALRKLMNDEETDLVTAMRKKKVKDRRQMSKKALMEGGSSYLSLERFIEDIDKCMNML